MANPTILVLTAVLPEARALARAFHLAKIPADLPFWRGKGLSLACVGVAAGRMGLLPIDSASTKPQLVVMAGVAGALSPELRRGHVVVDAREVPYPLPNLPSVRMARLHTSSTLVTSPAQKSQLFKQTGCLAVDMETDIAWRFAQSQQAAFVAVRGISDAADESLDPRLLALVDTSGKPRLGRAIGMICSRPWILPELLKLQAATNSAMSRVAAVIDQLIASGWPANTPDRGSKA